MKLKEYDRELRMLTVSGWMERCFISVRSWAARSYDPALPHTWMAVL
jgi:hypothetical protein